MDSYGVHGGLLFRESTSSTRLIKLEITYLGAGVHGGFAQNKMASMHLM